MDESLTLKEAAERVGVSPSTLRRRAESGVMAAGFPTSTAR